MRKTCLAIVALAAAMAFSSCDHEKTTAQKRVSQFLKDHLANTDFKIMDYSRLDSTKLVSDSVVRAMRTEADRSGLFKAPITYADTLPQRKLMFLRVKYRTGADTIRQTFYLDEQLSGIVSLKNG